MTMADRMIVMNAGVAEQIGTPLESMSAPTRCSQRSSSAARCTATWSDSGEAFTAAVSGVYRVSGHNEEVRLAPDPAYLHLFDPETGKRLV
jgi:ABC-type Fe3+/spermidine/putrescine transport system ATPase subunit